MGRSSVLDAHHDEIRMQLAAGVGRNELARRLSQHTGQTIDPTGLRKYIKRNFESHTAKNLWKKHDGPCTQVQGKTVAFEECPDDVRLAIARMVLDDSNSDDSGPVFDSHCDRDYDHDSDFFLEGDDLSDHQCTKHQDRDRADLYTDSDGQTDTATESVSSDDESTEHPRRQPCLLQ